MGYIGKPIKRLELVPLPDDVPVPEVAPAQPAPEPEPQRPREPVKVGIGMREVCDPWPPQTQ